MLDEVFKCLGSSTIITSFWVVVLQGDWVPVNWYQSWWLVYRRVQAVEYRLFGEEQLIGAEVVWADFVPHRENVMLDGAFKCFDSPTLIANFWGVVLQGVWVPYHRPG